MPKQGEGMTWENTEVKFVVMTTHKTVTHKLFHSPRSYFCIVTACAGGHTTTVRPSSFTNWVIIIVIIMICDPYFFLVRRDRENSCTFLACLRSGVRCPMAEVEDSLSAILSHSYFSNGITCVAVQLVANCFS